jgi:chorismate lyase / 3-hydroxybenzoate synthase
MILRAVWIDDRAVGAILQQPLSSHDQLLASSSGPSFAVHYADCATARALLSHPTAGTLGVIGYGTERPNFLPSACPFVAAPLLPAIGEAMLEIWSSTSPVRPCRIGPVSGASNGELVFGAIRLEDTTDIALEEAVEKSYLAIFDFLEQSGFGVPIRFWNYLTEIAADERGLERYRRFNIGRHRAFSARLREPVPPVASGVGGHRGASVIYFLSARGAARPLENPRQVNAYEYPPIYGPSSPRFSRASIFSSSRSRTLFIAGTASIVGHETRHVGELAGQIAETTENLRALIRVAEQGEAWRPDDRWALKVYLREATYREAVNAALHAMFGTACQPLYLRGDICRSDLLIEIEAVRQTTAGYAGDAASLYQRP